MEDNMARNILITGASGDIGKYLASMLSKNGFIVSGTYFSDEKSKIALEENDSSIYMYKCDLRNEKDIIDLFNNLKKDNRMPDILINNAGISVVGLLQDLDFVSWNNLWNSNVTSAIFTSKCALPHMIDNKSGCIINISSVWGNVGASCEVAYSATKGAINSFTKALARELAPSNISVNAIACGIIDTKMNSHLSADDLAAIQDEIPANRIGTPEDIFSVVLAIINSSSYMTGQVITVDGAWTYKLLGLLYNF